MKRRILKDAEGNDIAVTELESFSNMDELIKDPDEFLRRAEKEEEDDARIGLLASNLLPLYDKAKVSDRAINYWQIGKAIDDFEKSLPARERRDSWLLKSNILDRVAQKINRKGLSRRHLEEMIYFHERWKETEIRPKIPWSFYAELAIKANKLAKGDIEKLEMRIIAGTITDHKKLRKEIGAHLIK